MPRTATSGFKSNQQGFASLVIGLMLVVILALMAVGFAQLSFHEQHQALDNQLADQAYYAAESGINDAISDMTTHVDASGKPYINAADASNQTCMSPITTGLPAGALTASPTISAGVSYSCLLVNLALSDIEYQQVNPDSSRTVITRTSAPLDQLTIHWASADGHIASPPAPNAFTTNASWATSNFPPVLQFSITPLAAMDRSSLVGNSFTVFAYPSSGGTGTVDYKQYLTTPSADGQIVGGQCVNPGPGPVNQPFFTQCSLTIKGLGAVGGPYLIHFLDLYDASNVAISGVDSGGSPVTFTGGQALIDVTGKAKNVLKRLQVRIPLSSPQFPDYALEAQNICKRMEAAPNNTQFLTSSLASASGYCKLDQ